MNNIFIIIVAYNGLKWLKKCLNSAYPYTIIVVDNNSTDSTINYIGENFPEVILLTQKTNLGFGQANNLGIALALKEGANYVFLLNQDAYLEPGSIEKLIEVQQNNPEFGILSPLHLNGKGNRLDRNFSYYLNYQANPDFYSDYIFQRRKKQVYNVPFVNAAGWLISKKCLEFVGGFDPIFFHYGEDDNYCQRVIYHGFKIGVVPDATLNHDREDRVLNKSNPDKEENLYNTVRFFKVKFADINISYNSELQKMAANSKKAIIKNLIKLNFEKIKYFKKESEMFKLTHKEIIRSRSINKDFGQHYIRKH